VFETGPLTRLAPAAEKRGRGYYKDAFHRYVVDGDRDAVKRDGGTKAAAVRVFEVPAGGEVVMRLRLAAESDFPADPFLDFDAVLTSRIAEADAFYQAKIPPALSDHERAVSRQAYAGLLWSEQFYQYVIPDWIAGDKNHPNPPEVRDHRINRDWQHLFSRDVLSVPDKWEYPAFFAWDLAFHMVPMARIDPRFAKDQLLLLLRAMIGIIPLLAVYVLDEQIIAPHLPEFGKRLLWFLDHRKELIKQVSALELQGEPPRRRRLLALPTRDRLINALRYLLDEKEFLSPFGVRSLSKVYERTPYVFHWESDGREFAVRYVPGDMDTGDFGGNSNWRGPIWLPVNFLLIEALRAYHDFYGTTLRVECPTGNGRQMTLGEVADELAARIGALFLPTDGRPRPFLGAIGRYAEDPLWKDHILFFEYFDGETGRGLGASHQTGWTSLVARLLHDRATRPGGQSAGRPTKTS
jgi:hypothetical protein